VSEDPNIVTARRQNTRLESEGAEFLVLGHLLIEGIAAYKAYVNFRGYDLMAVNPETRRVARLQVKSRWATNYDKSFPIKSFDCDFVVHVALNRGFAFGKTASGSDQGVHPPEFFIFPVDVVRQAQSKTDSWGKVRIPKIPNFSSYRENWHLISSFLSTDKTLSPES